MRHRVNSGKSAEPALIPFDAINGSILFPLVEIVHSKQSFAPHDVNDENRFGLDAIEDSQWRNDQVPIDRSFEVFGMGAELREFEQSFGVFENLSDEISSGLRLIQRNVIGDSIEVLKSRFGPDQSSHRDILCFA